MAADRKSISVYKKKLVVIPYAYASIGIKISFFMGGGVMMKLSNASLRWSILANGQLQIFLIQIIETRVCGI